MFIIAEIPQESGGRAQNRKPSSMGEPRQVGKQAPLSAQFWFRFRPAGTMSLITCQLDMLQWMLSILGPRDDGPFIHRPPQGLVGVRLLMEVEPRNERILDYTQKTRLNLLGRVILDKQPTLAESPQAKAMKASSLTEPDVNCSWLVREHGHRVLFQQHLILSYASVIVRLFIILILAGKARKERQQSVGTGWTSASGRRMERARVATTNFGRIGECLGLDELEYTLPRQAELDRYLYAAAATQTQEPRA